MELTVVSYNICAGKTYVHFPDKSRPYDATLKPCLSLAPAAQTLRGLSPQIVGLNEVDYLAERSGGIDMALQLGKALGMNSIYGPAVRLEGSGKDALYGNALLSSYPILEEKVFPIEDPVRDEEAYYEPRAVLRVKLGAAGGISVFVAHLGLSVHERQNGVTLLCRLLDETEGPAILMGDFNMRPWDFLHRPLRERLNDTAALLGTDPVTFPSCALNTPDCRLDYIYVSAHFKVRALRAVKSKASDHYPLAAELEI